MTIPLNLSANHKKKIQPDTTTHTPTQESKKTYEQEDQENLPTKR